MRLVIWWDMKKYRAWSPRRGAAKETGFPGIG
jgi:hypothetical protein